jgi:hypothetical protein
VDSVGDVERLGRSFERHLRAENKSPKTVTTYSDSVTQLRAYLVGEASPQIVAVFVPGLLVIYRFIRLVKGTDT